MNRQREKARATIRRRPHVRCHYCQTKIPRSQITLDHAVPKSKGGTYSMINMRAACEKCNKNKGAKNAVEFFDELESRIDRRP
jgi:5-methylcytosine-specific restriction endonuclease McrA